MPRRSGEIDTRAEEFDPLAKLGSYTVAGVTPDKELDDLPPVDPRLVVLFQVATKPPLAKEQVDALSHLMADYLIVNGFTEGEGWILQDPRDYERGKSTC